MEAPPLPSVTALGALEQRMGTQTVERRLGRERYLWVVKHRPPGPILAPFGDKDGLFLSLLKIAGLARRARREYLDVRLVTNEIFLRRLPKAFDGFRLLQLTDLHCDLDPALIPATIRALQGVSWDLAILTGDFHNHIAGDHTPSLRLMEDLLIHLPGPRVAIMGNHDFLARAAEFEERSLQVLLNENLPLERNGERLWLCGCDDPRFFRTHDLARSRSGVPDDECAILLAHSPQVWKEAAALGFDLMISGHTHGGQICLPGGFPIVRNAPIPTRLIAGHWCEGSLQGYTSRGTGACGVPARLFCPAEITLHILRKAG